MSESTNRLPLLRPENLSPAQHTLYKQIDSTLIPWAQKAGFEGKLNDGRFLGPFNPFLYSPKIAEGFLTFMHAEGEHTTLSKSVREVVILTVGAVWHSAYELYAHAAMANHVGLPEEVIEALARGESPAALTSEQAVAHQFSLQLTRNHTVADDLYMQAESVFGQQGLVDLTFLLGVYLYTCVTLNAFCIPAPTQQP